MATGDPALRDVEDAAATLAAQTCLDHASQCLNRAQAVRQAAGWQRPASRQAAPTRVSADSLKPSDSAVPWRGKSAAIVPAKG